MNFYLKLICRKISPYLESVRGKLPPTKSSLSVSALKHNEQDRLLLLVFCSSSINSKKVRFVSRLVSVALADLHFQYFAFYFQRLKRPTVDLELVAWRKTVKFRTLKTTYFLLFWLSTVITFACSSLLLFTSLQWISWSASFSISDIFGNPNDISRTFSTAKNI